MKRAHCLTTALRSRPFTARPSEPAVYACNLNPVCLWFSPQSHSRSDRHTWDSQWHCGHVTTPMSFTHHSLQIPFYSIIMALFLSASSMSDVNVTIYTQQLTQLGYKKVEVKLTEPQKRSIENFLICRYRGL